MPREHFSLLLTKEWFSCSACDFKGNIWTLRKMGLVEFDDNGDVNVYGNFSSSFATSQF